MGLRVKLTETKARRLVTGGQRFVDLLQRQAGGVQPFFFWLSDVPLSFF